MQLSLSNYQRFQALYCHSGDPEEHATPNFSPTTRWQHQKFNLLLHPTDGSTPQLLHQALPNLKSMTISQHKGCDALHSTKSVTHFTAQSLHVPAHSHKMGVYYLRICTQHNYCFLGI
ncbi:hypothetical protein AVEN_44076-1 [Araneus ventricosus]|uniref:Uncharacterized protein n=1 Tax=Araneus ventricosus TaxID=182803 RepID=A0A4Y2WY66_ARAVE|nr:hypothetical protein AVEN_44076-1 [Araneus ventricosus]